jgi:hypothetical protein
VALIPKGGDDDHVKEFHAYNQDEKGTGGSSAERPEMDGEPCLSGIAILSEKTG